MKDMARSWSCVPHPGLYKSSPSSTGVLRFNLLFHYWWRWLSSEEMLKGHDTNPYRQLVADYAKHRQEGKLHPCGGFATPKADPIGLDAPKVLIFSPHPDDECIVGGLALRFLRQCGFRVINVAVTLGSNKDRQMDRWRELESACAYMGFGLIGTGASGLEKVQAGTRSTEPQRWAKSVGVITEILREQAPWVIFFPHDRDWNSTHIGTHLLVTEAMTTLGNSFECYTVETEYWGQMADPNLMVESSEEDVVDMVTGTSFHVGEVTRNPFHTLLPAWMQDNVRRGSELVGGQGKAAPDFGFATLYRLRRWKSGGFHEVLNQGRHLPIAENPGGLLG